MTPFKRALPLFLMTAAALCTVPSAASEVPPLLPIQGELVDGDGLVDGPRDLALVLYDTKTGGDPLYSETHTQVEVDQGQFVAYLGNGDGEDPLALSLFRDHSELWLEVVIDGTEVIEPRFRLGTAPFAAQANTCREADHAASADTAAEADHAKTADSATSASTADEADHATTADSATSADQAKTCTSATRADEADHATTADQANKAINSEKLGGKKPSEYTYYAGDGLQRSNSNAFSIGKGDVEESMLERDLTYNGTWGVTEDLNVSGNIQLAGTIDVGHEFKQCDNSRACTCPSGTRLLSGGATGFTTVVAYSRPKNERTWEAGCAFPSAPTEFYGCEIRILCARLGD